MTKRKETPPFSKRTGAGDHEVGYGKPPKDGQFKPGKSGNPKGRPKGAKNKTQGVAEERLKAIILEEAYRTVQIQEKGKVVTTTMATAIIRTMAVKAAKGQSRSAKYFTDLVAMAEADKRRRHDEIFEDALEYKAYWEAELRRREMLGIKGLAPALHPDDVVLDFKTGDVSIIGPMSQEEKRQRDKGLERLRAYEQEVKELELMIADEEFIDIRDQLVKDKEASTRVRDKLREAFGTPGISAKKRQKLLAE